MVILLLTFVSPVSAYAKNADLATATGNHQNLAMKEVTERFDTLVDVMSSIGLLQDDASDTNNLSVAVPYIVYHAEEEIQDEIYYFPVYYNENDAIICTIEAIYFEGRFVLNISGANIEILNEIDYVNEECIVYTTDGNVCFETEKKIIVDSIFYSDTSLLTYDTISLVEANEFMSVPFESKRELLKSRLNNLRECKRSTQMDETECLNARMYGILTLYKPQGQYGLNMCWASAAATVINYISGRVVTGYDVCNRAGVGYDAGGTVYDIQDGLAAFGIEYDYIRATSLAWSQLTTNIDAGKPVIANCFPQYSQSGHAVTLYGYTGSSSTNGYVTYWDSSLNRGTGGSNSFEFGSGEGVFSTGDGFSWFWTSTVSYY